MRLLILCSLLLCITFVQALGFLRSIRGRVENTVNNPVDEVRSITNQEINEVKQDVSQSTNGPVQNVLQKTVAGQYQRQQTYDQGMIVRTQRIGILAMEPSREFILQSERGMRESHAEEVARDNAPAAQLNF